jgi:hypothetical protein
MVFELNVSVLLRLVKQSAIQVLYPLLILVPLCALNCFELVTAVHSLDFFQLFEV